MKKICLFLLMAFALTSCVKDVVMDANEKPKVAVICVLSNESVQELTLFYTKGASKKEQVPVEEATATLTDESLHEVVGSFRYQDNGIWTLDYCAEKGHHYKLEITVPGYEMITAEQSMPQPARILAYGRCFYKIQGLNFPSAIPEIYFVPNAEDFDYLPLGPKEFYVQTLPDAVWIYARNYDAVTGKHTTAGEICTNYPYADDLNVTGTYYEPPRRTDIPNQFVDNSHVSELYPCLAGAVLHKGFLRFPARDLSDKRGWWFSISGSLEGKYNCKDFYQVYYGDHGLADPLAPDEGYIEVVAMSKDMDAYLADAYYKQEIQASSDLSSIFIRDNVYTNIVGGLGIFGATYVRKYQWSNEYEYVDDGIVHHYYAGPGNDNTYISDDRWPL